MSFGLLFSGQGSQKAGMGLDFLNDSLFKETIEQASEASKQDLVAIFKSEHDELKKTIHVQPALVAFESGIYRMLMRDLPNLDVTGMLGLSLGEYGAMFASNALSLEETIALVSDRAKYMQEDADKEKSTMAALLKPKLELVQKILKDMQNDGQRVYIANYNSPKQIVIGGPVEDIKLAVETIQKQAAAKKAVVLDVNGAFHTPLFNNAGQKMHERLKQVNFKQNDTVVVSNTTARPFDNNWGEIMEKQLAVPTHFAECLQYLINQQKITATLEIGPGKTLTGFAKQVDRHLDNYRIGSYAEYEEFLEKQNAN